MISQFDRLSEQLSYCARGCLRKRIDGASNAFLDHQAEPLENHVALSWLRLPLLSRLLQAILPHQGRQLDTDLVVSESLRVTGIEMKVRNIQGRVVLILQHTYPVY